MTPIASTPGVDFKLRILEERAYAPEISIGAQSAIGHKRTAGEYIALSKRYKNFDFTGGLGWGRYASAGHFDNPLKIFGNHFDKSRALDGENPNRPDDWFTGKNMGVFAGVEYFPPFEWANGLSLKADYGSDRYETERAAFGYNAPAPWSLGVNYKPAPWADVSLAALGTDKVMARLSLQSMLQKWPSAHDKKANTSKTPFRPYRTAFSLPSQMQTKAQAENIYLYNATTDGTTAHANLELQNIGSTPAQLRDAVKHISYHAGQDIEEIEIRPSRLGLYGPKIKMQRRDFENALAKNNGSAEEIWHNTEIQTHKNGALSKHRRSPNLGYGLRDYFVTLENQASLSEEDSRALYRTSLIAGGQAPRLFGWLDTFFSFRLNIKDNLSRLDKIRPKAIIPVRSDIDDFADRTFALDTAYDVFTHSFRSDMHLSLMGGYLEEQFAGAGGEFLYRPHNARWALGTEGFISFKRDPTSTLNLNLQGSKFISGHIQGWYDFPHWDLTLNAKYGRFLAKDIAGTLTLQKRFDNGSYLEAFTSLSNKSDFDLFGDKTHTNHGIRLVMPLGGFSKHLEKAKIDTRFEPLGRDIGQSIRNPQPLYELTEGFSVHHLANHWNEITP